jgi:hypothetical protein
MRKCSGFNNLPYLFILARCQDTLGKLGLAVEGMVRVAFEPVRQSVLASARQLIVQGLLKFVEDEEGYRMLSLGFKAST